MKTVVVVGQERSGTTMLMEILFALGVERTGFERPGNLFENDHIASLLSQMTPPGFKFNRQIEPTEDEKKLFEEKLALLGEGRGTWAWKVPRFLYFSIDFAAYVPSPAFLVITRNPYAAALSEASLLDLPIDHAMYLVRKRQSLVDEFIYQNPESLVVQYERFLFDTEREVNRVARFIDFPVTEEALAVPRLKLPADERVVQPDDLPRRVLRCVKAWPRNGWGAEVRAEQISAFVVRAERDRTVLERVEELLKDHRVTEFTARVREILE